MIRGDIVLFITQLDFLEFPPSIHYDVWVIKLEWQ
jgi:hypothetical protein